MPKRLSMKPRQPGHPFLPVTVCDFLNLVQTLTGHSKVELEEHVAQLETKYGCSEIEINDQGLPSLTFDPSTLPEGLKESSRPSDDCPDGLVGLSDWHLVIDQTQVIERVYEDR